MEIKYRKYRHYTEIVNCIVTGKAFYEDNLYSEEKLCQLISTWNPKEKFINHLRKLNGFYVLVRHSKNYIIAAVDRVRSIPLFYGQKGSDFFLSDSAEWVRQQLGNTRVSELSKEEFFLTGFVSGQDTLFPDVKQLQAGELLTVNNNEDKITIKTTRYYSYINEYKEEDKTLDNLLVEYEKNLIRVFNRLIKVASGKTIVVPLSGGYDSRLIVLMLKKLKYDKVIAFSYGKKENEEALISNYVGKQLGIRWEFIPYTNESWYKWYRDTDMKKYFHYAGNLSALPHIQDWPAIYTLKNIIKQNAIFVPGISADLNTGGFTKKYPKIYSIEANIEDLINQILEYSYSLFPISKTKNKQNIINKIFQMINKEPYIKKLIGDSYECWVSIEKVAKFVINSVRVYEYWGYEWWTPFWDDEFVSFWCKVPLILRTNQKLYKEHLVKLTKDLGLFSGIDPLFRDGSFSQNFLTNGYKAPNNKNIWLGLKNMAKYILPETIKQILRKKRQFIRHLSQFQNHPLQWYGIYHSNYIVKQVINGATNINSIIVLDYLKIIKENVNSKGND